MPGSLLSHTLRTLSPHGVNMDGDVTAYFVTVYATTVYTNMAYATNNGLKFASSVFKQQLSASVCTEYLHVALYA